MPIAKSSRVRQQAFGTNIGRQSGIRMDIRFVSLLKSTEEKLFAPALLKAVAAILDQLPIAYTVRIETTGADVFQHAHAAPVPDAPKSDMFDSSGANGNGRTLNHYLGRVAHS